MTLPNGIQGISEAIGSLFAISGDPSAIEGWGTSSISSLPSLTQPVVSDLLKANVIAPSAGWNNSAGDVWGGLRRGNPLDGAVPLPLAIIEQWVSQLTGLPVGTWNTVNDTLAAIEGLPGIQQVIQLITGIEGFVTDPTTTLQTWAANLQKFLFGLGLNNSSFNISDALRSWFTNQLLPLFNELPLNAGKLFGTIGTELLNILPVGSLSSTAPNRIPNPNFTADAILNPGDWTVDMSTSRTAGDGTGSAHIVADGHQHTLVTGKDPSDKIPVGPGQNVPAEVFVSHTGAVAGPGGAPAQLIVQPFNGDIALTPVVVATYTPANPLLLWPGQSIAGTYRVPDTGVDSVQIEVEVTPFALQGEWWFDEADTKQASDMSVIPGLPGTLQLFKSDSDALLNGIESVAKGFPVIGSTIATAMDAMKQFNPLNIGGSQGGTNLPGDFGSILDLLVGGLRGHPVSGSSPADLYTAASQAATNVANTDVTTNLDITGSFPINSWANWLDVAGVATGQTGQAGNLIEFGQGGQPGKFNATMWHRGTDFDSGVTQVNFTVNSDGSIRFDLPAGTATTAKSMTIPAGSGTQSPHFGSGYTGIGLGNQLFNSGNFACGGNQSSPGGKGLGPGGGGAGSLIGPGGKGAGPRGWVRQRANAVTGQVTGYDTVAPTTPTPHFFAASNSVLTVYGTGSTDTDSGMAGYNFYVRVAGVDTKQNNTPIAEGVHFDITALTPNTDYQASLFITATDNAGNETAKVSFAGTGAVTLNPTPATSPIDSTRAAAIDAIVAACMAAGDPATGVTIAIRSPFGYMTKSYGTNTGNDKHYLIASQTKMFTGYKIAMLVDSGVLHFDDHLSDYLDGYPVDPTIQQMLQMQSGLFDYEASPSLGQNFTLNPTMAMTVDQIIAIIQAGGTGPSVFTPGTSYFYTNSAYYVLAKIIEAVDPTHRPYDQIMKDDIFTPLGMVNTKIRMATGTPPAPYAVGQDFNPILSVIYGLFGGLLGPVPRRDVSSQNPAFIWAAGAGDSVISDMILFIKEMRDGTLISSGMKDQRLTTFVQQAASPAYGLKFQGPPTYGHGLGILQIGSWFGHDGSWLGYDSCSMYEPHTGTLISVYENFQTTSPHVLAALTTIWYEIASYLYPGSTNNPGYLSGEAGTGTMVGTMKKMGMDSAGTVYAPGGFTPFAEVNVAQTGQPIPAGATNCFVSLIGQGGHGGAGGGNINQSGGSGGGGGGRVNRIQIPVSALGSTYTTTIGPNARFQSGSIDLKALVGAAGAATATYGGSIAGGLGGSWSATPSTINGITVTGANGLQGATAGMYGASAADNDSMLDCAAGGGAGGGNTNNATASSAGGNSMTQTGGANGGASAAGSAPTDVDTPPPAHGGAGGGGGGGAPAYGYSGGAGGHGGGYGGGGGGGGCTWGGGAGPGGVGGECLVLVEWE